MSDNKDKKTKDDTKPKPTVPVAVPVQAPTLFSGMDELNKKAATILFTEGEEAAIKHMFQHPYENRQMSYSQMRSFYG